MALNMTENQLIGRRVVSQDGHVIGDVASLVVDTGSWRLVEVAVRLLRRAIEPLGMKKPWIGTQTIRVPVQEIAGVSDAVVLKHSLDDLTFIARDVEASQPPAEPPGTPSG